MSEKGRRFSQVSSTENRNYEFVPGGKLKERLKKSLSIICFLIALFTAATHANAENYESPIPVLTLKEVINEVLNNNPALKQVSEKEKSARELEKSSTAELLPKFSLSYSYTRLKDVPFGIFANPMAPGGGTKIPIGEENNFSWRLQVTQPVFTGFGLITKRRIAKLGVNLEKLRSEQIEIELVKEAKVLYYKALFAKHYFDVARNEVKQLTSHVKDAKQFYKQGLIPYNDLLKSEVALSRAKQKLVQARNNLETAMAALNTIMNRDITQQLEIKDIFVKHTEKPELTHLYDEAIKNRPELAALKIALKQAELNVTLAKSEFYPKVFIVGSYFQEGSNPQVTNNDFKNAHNASIGFEAQWSFFEWGKTRANVQRAIYEKRALEHELEKATNEIKLEVKRAFSALQTAIENIETARLARTQAKENFRITNIQYKQNMTTSTEVLDAQTFLTEAEVNYLNAIYSYLIARAKLQRAIGKKTTEY